MALRTVAIVQARMGASRLPNKMMLYLHGYPIIEWVYRRLKSCSTLDEIVFALPDVGNDDVLYFYLKTIGANCFRGSENDVVNRYVNAAEHYQADIIVRVCADNPLVCASEIDRLVHFYHDNSIDYAYNHIPRNNNYPDGLGAEICDKDLLFKIDCESKTPEQREHLFNLIWDNQERYNIGTFDPPREIAYPKLKLDIDTHQDYLKLLNAPYRIEMDVHQVVKTSIEYQ